MQGLPSFRLLLWTCLTISALHSGWAGKCSIVNNPTVKQTQIGFKYPPRFAVDIQNSCPTCPVIDVHLKCGSFPQKLVSPKLFRVLGHNDCVVNGGLPLQPLQKISFTYTHRRQYSLSPATWYFQCE